MRLPDLKANGGKCVVIPGEQQPAAVHLAAIAINQALGNVGKTVIYTETVNPLPSIQGDDLKSLVADMNAGKVDWLVILNANPVYAAPADLEFEDALNKAKTVVHLGSHYDETGRNAQWHVNSATLSRDRGRMRVRMTAQCQRDPADDRSALRRAHGARDSAVVARQP